RSDISAEMLDSPPHNPGHEVDVGHQRSIAEGADLVHPRLSTVRRVEERVAGESTLVPGEIGPPSQDGRDEVRRKRDDRRRRKTQGGTEVQIHATAVRPDLRVDVDRSIDDGAAVVPVSNAIRRRGWVTHRICRYR